MTTKEEEESGVAFEASLKIGQSKHRIAIQVKSTERKPTTLD